MIIFRFSISASKYQYFLFVICVFSGWVFKTFQGLRDADTLLETLALCSTVTIWGTEINMNLCPTALGKE